MGLYPKKKPKSIYRGVKYVGLNLGKRLWVASFTHNNKTQYSPKFQSELLAAKWYDRTALKYLGDRAVLNCPDKIILKRVSTPPLTTSKRSRDEAEDASNEDASDDADADEDATDEDALDEDALDEDASDEADELEKPVSKYVITTCETDKPSYVFFSKDTVRKAQPVKAQPAKAQPAKKYQTGRKRKKFTQQTKNKICSRQKWDCNYCKKRLTDVYHIDHMVPLFIGGTNETWNLQALCPSCDSFKTAYIDNKILFPLSKKCEVKPSDVIKAQKDNYHKMECLHPDAKPAKDTNVTNTINLSPSLINIGDLSKLLTDLGSSTNITISIQPNKVK